MREGPLSELFRNTEREALEGGGPIAAEDPGAPVGDLANYLAVIRVVGVGGAGCNAVNRMVEAGIRGVEFVAVNTDRQALDACDAEVRIPVGMELTRGLGTGGDAARGEAAFRESEDQIRRALRGSDLVFIAAGEGGGTGSGGAPVVAKVAREQGALTIAVVTRPFRFEGSRRTEAAEAGIDALHRSADTVIVIPNERLMSVLEHGTSVVQAFRVCDDLLRQGVQGICDLITLPGLINLDFADVRTIIRDAGTALLGIGYAGGGNRATEAAQAAIASPLLETPIDGARGILLGITGGPDLSLFEVNEAAQVVADAADPEANIIFGATVDPDLDDNVWVTVVAANFTGHRAAPARPVAPLDEARPARSPRPAPPVPGEAPRAAAPARAGAVSALEPTPDMAEPPEPPDLSAGVPEAPPRHEPPYPVGPAPSDEEAGATTAMPRPDGPLDEEPADGRVSPEAADDTGDTGSTRVLPRPPEPPAEPPAGDAA
jgi:cell division protein FtsZ